MSALKVNQYWSAITVIEADEMWKALQIEKFPHLPKKAMRRFENSLIKQKSKFKKSGKAMTTGEIVNHLMRSTADG